MSRYKSAVPVYLVDRNLLEAPSAQLLLSFPRGMWGTAYRGQLGTAVSTGHYPHPICRVSYEHARALVPAAVHD